MDCTTAAWVSIIGSLLQIAGVMTVAADLRYLGRVPNVKGMIRRLRRRPPSVVYGQASSGLHVGADLGADSDRVQVLPAESDTGGVEGRLRKLERRLSELGAEIERERSDRADADARLERSIQPTLQSLQNEITALRHDLMTDRERVRSRAGIGWLGIAMFITGLLLNAVGTGMAAGCAG